MVSHSEFNYNGGIMNTYPTLNQEGLAEGWSERLQDDTTVKGLFNTGRPFTITYRTFDPLTYTHTLGKLTDASKVILDAFYAANKAVPFFWIHPGTLDSYTVQFDDVPVFVSMDDIDSWNVEQSLTQYNSVTITTGDYGYGDYGDGKYGGPLS